MSEIVEMKTQDDIEYKIKSIDVVLSLLRAEREQFQSLEKMLENQKVRRYIERIRADFRRELFSLMG